MQCPVINLMGPTASGKTSLAIELAARFPVDIISVDSALVYREMDIGTAKPSKELLHAVPHRLINIKNPDEIYSAGQFVADALREMKLIHAAGRIPLLVGGTMMYFRALQYGIAAMPAANAEIRLQLQHEVDTQGLQSLYEKLQQIDPKAALSIHAHDAQRIQRALEVFYLTGQAISDWQQQNNALTSEYDFYNLAIAPVERAILHKRIEVRFIEMLQVGLIDEVQALCQKYHLSADLPSMRSVGYRQVFSYLQGDMSKLEMQDKAIAATRQLAKRQLTWLRSWPDVAWFESDNALPNIITCLEARLR